VTLQVHSPVATTQAVGHSRQGIDLQSVLWLHCAPMAFCAVHWPLAAQ
jgi:hypothetical protein